MDSFFFYLANGRPERASRELRSHFDSMMEVTEAATMREVFTDLVRETTIAWSRAEWPDAYLNDAVGLIQDLIRDMLDLTIKAGLINPTRHLTLV